MAIGKRVNLLTSRVHAPSYKQFMDTIRELKAQGKFINRLKASKILNDKSSQSQSACSTPVTSVLKVNNCEGALDKSPQR